MFFSFFGKKMHKFARNLLSFTFSIACFSCIWVFGNIDYYPLDNEIEKMTFEGGEEIDIFTFEGNLEGPKVKPGYGNTLIRRMNSTNIGKLIVLGFIIYFVFIIIKFIYSKVIP